MTNQQEIEKKLKRLEKFNDPVLVMMAFLTVPALIMGIIFSSSIDNGTWAKVITALFFIFFTLIAFKVNSLIKQRIESLQSQLKAID
jgi:hypothetical protein